MPSTMHLQLGSRRFDLRERPVVVGILNRTRDSFFDRGAYYALDRLLEQAERLVVGGADVLEVGARPGGVGVAGVGPEEERDLAASTIAALRAASTCRWPWTPRAPPWPPPPSPRVRCSATT
jgi:dihydropteroate synthase